MLALDRDTNRFTTAKQIAAGLVRDSGRNDELVLITFGGQAELVAAVSGKEADTLNSQLHQLAASGRGEDLRVALATAERFTDQQLSHTIHVITDGAFTLPPLDDLPLEIDWHLVGDGDNNQAVIDLALEKGRQAKSELFFRIANYSKAAVTRQVEISVDGSVIANQTIELPPDSITPQTAALTGVREFVSVRLLGLDQMPGDDSAVLGASGKSLVKVAVVAENPYPLDRAIETIPGTQLEVFPPSVFVNDGRYDLVIYRGTVPAVWPAGTVLVFDLSPVNAVISVGPPVSLAVQPKFIPGSILDGAGLDSVRWEIASDLSEVTGFEELASAGDLPIILHQHSETSDVYLFAPLLGSGNFTKYPAFPILLSRFVSLARGFVPQPSYLVGDRLALPAGDYSLELPSGELLESSESRQIELIETGLYHFSVVDLLGGKREVVFGVNLGEVDESAIASHDWRTELALAGSESDRSWQRVEVDLTPWLLGITVFLLLIEAWRAWR
jgi:hypothetical protein